MVGTGHYYNYECNQVVVEQYYVIIIVSHNLNFFQVNTFAVSIKNEQANGSTTRGAEITCEIQSELQLHSQTSDENFDNESHMGSTTASLGVSVAESARAPSVQAEKPETNRFGYVMIMMMKMMILKVMIQSEYQRNSQSK